MCGEVRASLSGECARSYIMVDNTGIQLIRLGMPQIPFVLWGLCLARRGSMKATAVTNQP